jgi:uncharacterized protein (TIGR02145 family)
MIKKIRILARLLSLIAFVVMLTNNCKKEEANKPLPDYTVPVITTSQILNIHTTKPNCGGNITNDGGKPITSRGVCYTSNAYHYPPTIYDSITIDSSGSGEFISYITKFKANTYYYLRAYATNSIGTAYGKVIEFRTFENYGTINDIDGNIYNIVKISNQIWMAENLKTTKYNDGTNIPNISNGGVWVALTTGAYCDYNNDTDYIKTYGHLYNWYAVNDSRNLAPKGWHVATNNDWEILIGNLGGENYAGGMLMEEGTTHWKFSNEYITNQYGFSALPGGSRSYFNAEYSAITTSGYWWCSTMYDSEHGYCRSMHSSSISTDFCNGEKHFGNSVRCIKD